MTSAPPGTSSTSSPTVPRAGKPGSATAPVAERSLPMTTHKIVSHAEWIEARRQHLAREKELTRLRDRLAEERRALPWEKVAKPYVFDGPRGEESLADLFEARHQLIVYHFM